MRQPQLQPVYEACLTNELLSPLFGRLIRTAVNNDPGTLQELVGPRRSEVVDGVEVHRGIVPEQRRDWVDDVVRGSVRACLTHP